MLPFVIVASSLSSGVARADVSSVDGANAPIVRIQIPGQANLTIRTWDRPTVLVEGAESGAFVIERHTNRVPAMLPPTLIRLGQIKTADGNSITLPAESFVVSTLPAGQRTAVVVRAEPGRELGPVTITIPADTALLAANVGRGSLALRDYKDGTFILHLHSGTAQLDNVGGDGFVQVLRGPVIANDSNFSRLRARTAIGALIFERCRSRQIEATSVNGNIVYDGGTFDAGLARFDSTSGNVAIGVGGPAQFGARAGGSGKVYALFDRRAQVDNRDGEATAVVEGGGPVINATSGGGNVYLYDGSLRTRAKVPPEWRAPQALLRRVNVRNAAPPGARELPTPRELPKPRQPLPANPPPKPRPGRKFL
ncbi:MAG: hypothetical protein GIW95_10305 [Candidatus Eremiobacteraeota bacterium]|nr:hypothetical protein [Candidatus Eremiobacteraeota bacterium]